MAEQSLGASAATAELGATKNDLGGSTMADTKLLETTMHEGMTLIDRFYNGGNTAHPHALDILVVVLDNVVRRMRQQYATRKDSIAESNKQIARCDSNVDMIKPKQTKLQAELEEKRARAKELKDKIAQGANAINSSVDVAKAALEKANLLQRSIERQYIAGCKLCVQRRSNRPPCANPLHAAAEAPRTDWPDGPLTAGARRATTRRGGRCPAARRTCAKPRWRRARRATWR
jgi:chemotaxis protein histidine kinase CheA